MPELCGVTPVPDATLVRLYGTTQPSRDSVEPDLTFFEEMNGRGCGWPLRSCRVYPLWVHLRP